MLQTFIGTYWHVVDTVYCVFVVNYSLVSDHGVRDVMACKGVHAETTMDPEVV